jgi:SNF2 family DNA or RNA helicase
MEDSSQMVLFWYSGTNHTICVNAKSSYQRFNLKGGIWRQKGNRYFYPLNDENIEILFKDHPDGKTDRYNEYKWVWKYSLWEAIYKYLGNRVKKSADMLFLNKLKIDNVSRFPKLYTKEGMPEPFKNQHISQFWQQKTDYHAYLWEMGTGKTRAGVEGYEIKHRQGKIDHLLVICPLSMLDKWVVEIEKWGHDGVQAVPLKGTRQEKLDLLKMDYEAVVVNFETCALIIDELLAVVNERWMIICDETTKIKNPRANRTKAVLDLGLRTEYKAILTGTPITQHAYDVFSQYAFLDSGKTFGLNYDAFLEKYFWKQGFKLISKGQWALDEVSDKMFKSSTRFLKAECIDIPDKLYDHRVLVLPTYNQQKYTEMVKCAITQIEGSEHVTAPIILTQLLRLSQITSGFVVDAMGEEVNFDKNPKLDALRDILEESNSSKMVIWARFRQDVRNISKLCESMSIKYVQLFGDVNNDQRTRNVAQFQNDPDCKVIIGTASTGGHGIDLVAGTIVVYFSNSYSLEQRLQSEDRTHRAGQTNKVTYIDLLCKDTIDISIYKILRSKKSVADIVTKDYLNIAYGG